jgi:hypothetical protein
MSGFTVSPRRVRGTPLNLDERFVTPCSETWRLPTNGPSFGTWQEVDLDGNGFAFCACMPPTIQRDRALAGVRLWTQLHSLLSRSASD